MSDEKRDSGEKKSKSSLPAQSEERLLDYLYRKGRQWSADDDEQSRP